MKRFLTIAGFFALTLIVYGQSLGNDFVNMDDGLLILGNPAVQTISRATLTHIFTSYDPELYIPLTLLSYQLNVLIGGLHPFGFHLVNILLHAGNALLIVWITELLFRKRWMAIVAGLLFVVHPLHTEAVAWAAARKDLLSSFFLLLSVAMFVSYRQDNTGKRKYWWSVFFLLLGLLSKVNAILMPIAVLCIDVAERKPLRRSIKELLPHILLSAIFIGIAMFGKLGGASILLEKFLLGAKASVFYLTKIMIPYGFSVLYPYTQPITVMTPDLLVPVIIIMMLLIIGVLLWRHSRWPLTGLCFYVTALAPSFINIAKGQERLRDIYFASDRYAYAASIAAFIAIAWVLERVRMKMPTIAHAVFLCILCFLCIFTARQSLVWANTETLFTHALKHYPNAQLAENFVGAELFKKGDLPGALEHYQNSLAIRPNAMAYFSIGVLAEKAGQTAQAAAAYQEAIAVNPDELEARINLGVLKMRQNEPGTARKMFTEAIAVAPVHERFRNVRDLLSLLYFNLGTLEEQEGRLTEALSAYRNALEYAPDDLQTMAAIRALEVQQK